MTERRSQESRGEPIDYFAILCVSRDAGQDEIEARYRELSSHLASGAIPAALKDWAAAEASLVDEAYAVLSDPERRAELEQAPRAALAAAAAPVAAHVPAVEYDDISAPEVTRADAGERPVSALDALFMGVPWKLMAIGAVIGVVVLGAIFFGSDLLSGGDDDSSTAGGQEEQLAEIDMERVAALTALVEQDSKNAEATFELGEIFFLGGEWQTGIDWFTKLLELDPTNVHALTDVGTAQFNLGQFEAAKTAWLEARELDPNDEQVHYNLGFLYANVDPVDYAAALAEWQLVVELAPGSDLANTAQVHLESLAAEASAAPPPAATEAPASPGG